MLRITTGFFAVLSCLAGTAQAHFVWSDFVETTGQPPQVRLCFGESPEPGEPHLIGKIAHSKAWVRGAAGTTSPVKLETKADDKAGALVANSPVADPLSFEAACDYGVYERAPGGTHLLYYAKHLADSWTSAKADALQADGLKLDIVPMLHGGKLDLLVRFDGQPDAGREVVIEDPAEKDHKLQTDEHGRVSLDAVAGRYAIRAGHVDAKQSGAIDGKKFAQTSSYATLTLSVPSAAVAAVAALDKASPDKASPDKTSPDKANAEKATSDNPSSPSAPVAPAAGEPTAKELLREAREARAVWENFPGYTADVTVNMANEEVSGKLELDSIGNVTLEMPAGPARSWVESHIASLAQHRMPDGEVTTGEVNYADSDTHHPFGRRIDLGDPKLGSVYRIRDKVIYEVNRNAGPSRFTISVLDVTWNRDHKYLPRVFAMSFFDGKTGELKHTATHLNEWERLGAFDVPSLILEISAGGKASPVRQMTFKNYRLSEAKR